MDFCFMWSRLIFSSQLNPFLHPFCTLSTAMSKELRATMAVARAWPAKLQSIQTQEAGEGGEDGAAGVAVPSRVSRLNSATLRGMGMTPPGRGGATATGVRVPATGDSRRTLRTGEVGGDSCSFGKEEVEHTQIAFYFLQVASETLNWLRTFDMESRLLGQLADLKMAAKEAVGRGLFSGALNLEVRHMRGRQPCVRSAHSPSRSLPLMFHK